MRAVGVSLTVSRYVLPSVPRETGFSLALLANFVLIPRVALLIARLLQGRRNHSDSPAVAVDSSWLAVFCLSLWQGLPRAIFAFAVGLMLLLSFDSGL